MLIIEGTAAGKVLSAGSYSLLQELTEGRVPEAMCI